MYVVVFSLLTANDVLAVAEAFVLLTTGSSAFSSVTRSAVLTVEDVRYATPKTSFYLNEGVNNLRFYAASRENVLERIILHKADREIPQSYLGPV